MTEFERDDTSINKVEPVKLTTKIALSVLGVINLALLLMYLGSSSSDAFLITMGMMLFINFWPFVIAIPHIQKFLKQRYGSKVEKIFSSIVLILFLSIFIVPMILNMIR